MKSIATYLSDYRLLPVVILFVSIGASCQRGNVVQVDASKPAPLTAAGKYNIVGSNWLDEIVVANESNELVVTVTSSFSNDGIFKDPAKPERTMRTSLIQRFPIQPDWAITIDEPGRLIKYRCGDYECVYDCSNPSESKTYETTGKK
jgi:hypothetical protein